MRNVSLLGLSVLLAACGEATLSTTTEPGDCLGCATPSATASSALSSVVALPQPGTIDAPQEGWALYDPSIDTTWNCGGTVLRPGVQAFKDYAARFGIVGNSYGGCQTGFHPIGQALDVYLDGSTVAALQPFADWLVANNGEMTRRLGIVQVIFNYRIWRSYSGGAGPQGGWGPYGGADHHTSHVHISFNEAGATGSTSFFTEVINGGGAHPVDAALPPFTVTAADLRLASVGGNRLLDTRNTGPLAPNVVTTAFTADQVGGASAVALGVTLVVPVADAFLSVAGTGVGSTSSVNAAAGTVRANQTLASLSGGAVSMLSNQLTHVVLDEQGRFGGSGAGFVALGPARALDTRAGAFLAAGEVRALPLGSVGVPASAVAAQLGLVALPRGAAGFISVLACGDGVTTSAVNFSTSQVASSSALAAVRGGAVCLFANVDTDVVVDVAGYYDAGGASLFLTEPARLLDTRTGEGGWVGRPLGGQVLRLELSGMPGWAGSSAVAFNLTSVEATAQNFARVWDCTGDPSHSNLNGTPGAAVATFGVVRSSGSLCVSTSAPQHLILDLVGVYR